MSYSSLPAVAVRSAFRSMVYISYCNTGQTPGHALRPGCGKLTASTGRAPPRPRCGRVSPRASDHRVTPGHRAQDCDLRLTYKPWAPEISGIMFQKQQALNKRLPLR